MNNETSKTLIATGVGLIGIQNVEHLLDVLLHTALCGESKMSAQELEKFGKLERHEPLCNLLKQLRAKVEAWPMDQVNNSDSTHQSAEFIRTWWFRLNMAGCARGLVAIARHRQIRSQDLGWFRHFRNPLLV